jgi:glycolate oxidase FAD binding subunit
MQASISHCQDQIRSAAADGQCLSIQGGGSKSFYGNVSHHDALLDTRDLSGIVSHEPSELCLTAWAGTPLAEVQAALLAHGQCLPFEPPHFGGAATVGGMVAAGLSGPSRAVVGGVRDFVLGIHLINGKGESLQFGGQVMKNVAGYDLSRAVSGSMGQLGLITQVSLKVLPIAPASATLQFNGLQEADALSLLHHWGRQPLPMLASAWLRDETLQPAQPVLFVRLAGARAAVDAALTVLRTDAEQRGAECRLLPPEQAERDWDAHTQQQVPVFTPAPHPNHALWRLSVAPTAPVATGFNTACIEWQGGVRWVWAAASRANELRAWATQHGGHATLFRASTQGGNADKQVGAFSPLGPLQAQLQERLRHAFDPQGVFHTGRLLPRSFQSHLSQATKA